MTPAQAMAAKAKLNNNITPKSDENEMPTETQETTVIDSKEENTMENPTPVTAETAEQTVIIPLSGISALITTLTDTQKNFMAFKFHDISAAEMTDFLTNVSSIQQCIQYLGDVVRANYGQNT